MKAIYKSLLAAVAVAPLLTGCIEETMPTSIIIDEQLESSPKGVEALVMAMPGTMNAIGTLDPNEHFDGGYSSLLHIHDVMTEDMYVRDAGGYNWYASWSSVSTGLGEEYLVCQFPWNFYYKMILTTNSAIGAISPEVEEPTLMYYRAAALAFRAFVYLDLVRTYEFLPTEFNAGISTAGQDILGLSVPRVDETTTEEQMRNNPRMPHAEAVEFIKGDLEEAVALFTKGVTAGDKTLPSLAVAYGLLARMYLWDASYQEEITQDANLAASLYKKAAEYAKLAYTTHGGAPLTREEWLDTTKGFNSADFSSWMFCGQYVTEDDAVQAGGIRTWSSFMCPESTFGYASPAQGAFPEIGASLYNRMNDRDFRKLSFTAAEDSHLAVQVPFIDAEFAAQNFDSPYISVKFRPGNGNMDDYTVGTCVAYPLMRVEEMYFIEAEATAHTNAGEGLKLLTDFMTKYRYSTYTTKAAGTDAVVEEIVFQKRIELWGEGLSFYDVKRLNYSVTRFYNGTNFEPGLDTFNTNGRPAWMNFVINRQEFSNNKALEKYNTPTPAGVYDAIQ